MGYLFDALNRPAKGAAAAKPQPAAPVLAAAPPAALPADAGPATEPLEFKPLAVEPRVRTAIEADLTGIDDRLVAITEPASLMAEEYRSIRTGMLARWQNRRNLIHTITSATPQEGKTITSLNLGLCFAELRNRRTLVVEADLRLPQFAKLLSLRPSPGLVGVLEDGASLRDAIHTIGPNNLSVMPAGRVLNDMAVQVLSGAELGTLLTRLREKFDHVIIDTPPVLEMADAGIIGTLSNDVMLVARLEQTPRSLIERAARTLANYNAPVTGLVATNQRCAHHSYYKYGYRYGTNHHKQAA